MNKDVLTDAQSNEASDAPTSAARYKALDALISAAIILSTAN